MQQADFERSQPVTPKTVGKPQEEETRAGKDVPTQQHEKSTEIRSSEEVAMMSPISPSVPRDCLVVVDPYSTGANCCDFVLRKGVACLVVDSAPRNPVLEALVDPNLRADYSARIQFDAINTANTVQELRDLENALGLRIIGVCAGCETGVECADELSCALGLLNSNGTELSEARRNKYIMHQQLAKKGVTNAAQANCTCWEEVEAFLQGYKKSDDSDEIIPVVFKPLRSAGSDGVTKVRSMTEARAAYERIMLSPNALGSANDSVLVMRFLEGTEYIVDTVSRFGKHKIVAIWEYDKRDHAGHSFVYYGMWSVSGTSEIGQTLTAYTLQVLDALGIRNGAGHAEVILTPTGPCLVEIGARPQGCEGTFMPVADRCWGYNQVDVYANSYLSEEEWEKIPDVCPEEKEVAYKLDFVSSVSGKLKRIDHLESIRSLPSFVQFDLLPSVGSQMHVTIDCFTACGSVSLVHQDRKQLQQDVDAVRQFEKTMWVVEGEETPAANQ